MIHLLQLSDGRRHPLATVDQTAFHLDYGHGAWITRVSVTMTECRLVVAVSSRRDQCREASGIIIWDWRNGRRLVSGVILYSEPRGPLS